MVPALAVVSLECIEVKGVDTADDNSVVTDDSIVVAVAIELCQLVRLLDPDFRRCTDDDLDRCFLSVDCDLRRLSSDVDRVPFSPFSRRV